MSTNIYNTQIHTEETIYDYIGMSAPPLRLRVATHIHSFKNNTNQTVLSEKVKELTDMKIENSVKFELLENRRPYSQNSG